MLAQGLQAPICCGDSACGKLLRRYSTAPRLKTKSSTDRTLVTMAHEYATMAKDLAIWFCVLLALGELKKSRG